MPMKFLFVSNDTRGGSSVSQRQLARRLTERGHHVEMLAATVESRMARPLYDQQVDLSTKLRHSPLRPALLALQRPMGRRIRRLDTPDHPTWVCAIPENGFRSLRRRFEPDVVVAASIDRVSWRRLRAQLQAAAIPSVLYLREASAKGHLAVTGAPPDLLLANAESLAVEARALGYECTVVPSIVELDRSRTETTRTKVVLVNPIEMLGGDRVWDMARARPDISFVLRQSNMMSEAEIDAVTRPLADHPNVALLPYTTCPAELYRDARILLVPHRVDNRPRVVLEAQANGIPVLATEFPGLIEAVGAGGTLVPNDAPSDAWVQALGAIWDDDDRYAALVRAARTHANRDEVTPDRILERFESLVGALVEKNPAIKSRPITTE
ncbi:MAG: glycosyltransferase [Acidimicrobiia bacterium]